MNRELDQKIAIVTGAAQGIGAAIADVMVREGATVIIADMNAEAAAAKAAELGGDCTSFAVNVAKMDQLQALVDFAMEKFGRIDLLDNACIVKQIDFLEIEIGRAHV